MKQLESIEVVNKLINVKSVIAIDALTYVKSIKSQNTSSKPRVPTEYLFSNSYRNYSIGHKL